MTKQNENLMKLIEQMDAAPTAAVGSTIKLVSRPINPSANIPESSTVIGVLTSYECTVNKEDYTFALFMVNHPAPAIVKMQTSTPSEYQYEVEVLPRG